MHPLTIHHQLLHIICLIHLVFLANLQPFIYLFIIILPSHVYPNSNTYNSQHYLLLSVTPQMASCNTQHISASYLLSNLSPLSLLNHFPFSSVDLSFQEFRFLGQSSGSSKFYQTNIYKHLQYFIICLLVTVHCKAATLLLFFMNKKNLHSELMFISYLCYFK